MTEREEFEKDQEEYYRLRNVFQPLIGWRNAIDLPSEEERKREEAKAFERWRVAKREG